jgi:multidrug resistance efflux pump
LIGIPGLTAQTTGLLVRLNLSVGLVEPGAYASNSHTVFRVVDISSVYVSAVVGEGDIAKVTRGQEAEVTVAGLVLVRQRPRLRQTA